ncbi:MAG: molybdenum cofactor biosynthesis protein MoaE [Acidobacteria bacterium]|nr:molybdenum cofactor biosynthesis protein MoaE [Acidobacteriota bacterium]
MSIEIVFAGLSPRALTVEMALAAVDSPECGAVVSFSGVVRNHDGGKDVARLSYTGHPSADAVMADVVPSAAKNALGTADPAASQAAPPVRIWAAHRLGPLEIGDPALVCAVAAAHRGEAFAVCSAVVDAIKAGVPIWKEQFFADGTMEWVGAESR